MKKYFLILFLFFLFNNSKSQNKSPLKFTFNHVALSVKDVDKAAEFYKSVLQLEEITNRSKAEGIRWFSLGENKELHLISTVKESFSLNIAIHFALTTNNFNLLLSRVKELKIPYFDWKKNPQTVTDRADGIKQIYIQDVDGYWIELNSEGEKK